MYANRIQISKYGPIDQLDISFPFEADAPKPIILVGENGSGKSILLSYIVNGLIYAKDRAYPQTPEVETGRVLKLRSPLYVRVGNDCYFGRVDFEDGLFVGEVVAKRPKYEYESIPLEPASQEAKAAWEEMDRLEHNRLITNLGDWREEKLRNVFSKNCALYFPPNRFEEPAWLNEENLVAQADFMDVTRIEGKTSRKAIAYSPLHDNQDWLFDLVYDFAALANSGSSTSLYEVALKVVGQIMRDERGVRFGFGPRRHRLVSVMAQEETLVPNIFQLSTGEVSLLNLFLSILRDFDLSGTQFSSAEDVRGIVVVDEVDLHIHAVHQNEILPSLIRMFPKVQFIVTTHSPLFVLGMNSLIGEDGFAVYRMPQGDQISPEEFSEFADAFQAYSATSKYSEEVRSAIENSRKPIVFLEGTTDIKYLQKAAELLQRESVLDGIELRDGVGDNLVRTWNAVKNLPNEMVPGKVVVVVRDCDFKGISDTKGNKRLRKIPKQAANPIEKGIENLFSEQTLQRAICYKLALIDIHQHKATVRGNPPTFSEKWVVNEDEKRNLCDWLCEYGTAEDFESFHLLFDLLVEALDMEQADSTASSA